jgi:hypothetical protein
MKIEFENRIHENRIFKLPRILKDLLRDMISYTKFG